MAGVDQTGRTARLKQLLDSKGVEYHDHELQPLLDAGWDFESRLANASVQELVDDRVPRALAKALVNAFATVQLQPLRRSMLTEDWNEGILGRLHDKKCVKRDKTVEQLRALVEKKGFVLLKAPPRSGKTGLLQLLEMSYPEDRLCAVNMTDKEPGMTWREFFEEQTKRSWQKCRSSGGGSDTPPQDDMVTLLLIDELQPAYPTTQQRSDGCDPMDELWKFIKHLAAADARARQYPLRIVAAAVYGDAPSYTSVGSASIADMLQSHATAPFEIGDDRQVRLHHSDADPDHPAMAYRDEEFDELWTLTWAEHESELFAGTATKEGIRWVTAKQPGVVAFILDNMERSVKEHKRSVKDDNETAGLQVQYLGDNAYRNMFRTRTMYDALQGTRSFLKLHDLSDDTELHLRLLRPLVEAGCGVEGCPEGAAADDLSEANRAHLAKCLKRGYLISQNHPVRGVLYSCATPLHLYFLEQQLLRARVQAVQQGPESFATFLQLIITRMSPNSLVQTLPVGSSTAGAKGGSAVGAAASGNILLERKLQMDLHATAFSLVPDNWTVCPDVGKVYGAPGLVDMWVASPDKTVQWAVEFIRNGSDLLEHERRFLPGGKYYNMPHTEFALIDSTPATSAHPSPHHPGKGLGSMPHTLWCLRLPTRLRQSSGPVTCQCCGALPVCWVTVAAQGSAVVAPGACSSEAAGIIPKCGPGSGDNGTQHQPPPPIAAIGKVCR